MSFTRGTVLWCAMTAIMLLGARTAPGATNQPPVANAGADLLWTVNVATTFNGSRSYDPDGTVVAYWWRFGDGGSTTTSTPYATYTYKVPGWYLLSLWVRDNAGTWSLTDDTALVAIGTTTTTTAALTSTSTSTTRPSTTSTSTSRPATTSTSTTQPVTTTTLAGQWARAIGGTDVDLGNAVASDGNGGRFVAGSFRGTIRVGTTTLTSAGASDAFLAKFDAAGTLLWAKRFGGSWDDTLTGIAVDPNGNVAAVGRFQGSASFGGTTLTSAGSTDIVIAKYSATGGHLWSKRFGDASVQSAEAVAVDPSGNVLVTGYFAGSIDFGTGVLRTPYVGDYDVFVAKLTGAGATVWAKGFVNDGNEFGNAIAADGSGNVVVTGNFNNSINFGGATLFSPPYPDAFLVKLSPTGAHVWSKAFGGSDGGDSGEAVAADTSGNVVIGINSNHPLNLGGGTLGELGGVDVVVGKFTAAGASVWSRRLGGTSTDGVTGVAIDANGNVLVEGTFRGTAGFGGVNLTSAGADDAFVAKYTASGGLRWAKQLGGTLSDYGNALAVTPATEPLVAGTFNGTGNFAGTVLTSGGNSDAFLVRLAP